MKEVGIGYTGKDIIKIYENDKGIKFIQLKGEFYRFDRRKVWKFKWLGSDVIIDGGEYASLDTYLKGI